MVVTSVLSLKKNGVLGQDKGLCVFQESSFLCNVKQSTMLLESHNLAQFSLLNADVALQCFAMSSLKKSKAVASTKRSTVLSQAPDPSEVIKEGRNCTLFKLRCQYSGVGRKYFWMGEGWVRLS